MTQPYKLIQSYVKEKFFISTIYRRTVGPVFGYYETIIWEWDNKLRKRGKLLKIEDSGLSKVSGLENHFALCNKYARM